jgi:DNA-binding transcriptional ArsR family regulator
MPNSEDETYSTMFSSLNHPARRKILRMLAEKPKNFSRILQEIGISSSHLTYHLENLGELISKKEDGKYHLSTFGEAAVITMKGVEEVPDAIPKHPLALPLKWKSIFALLIIGIIILSSLTYIQYFSLNQISTEYEQLSTDFSELYEENIRLSSWGLSSNNMVSFLEDVIQLDISEYDAELVSNTIEHRDNLGRLTEEIMKYTLKSDISELNVDFRFRNQKLSRYRIDVLEFSPVYSEPQATSVLDMAADILRRYQNYDGKPYLTDMRNMLQTVTELEDLEKTESNMKLIISTEGNDVEIQWIYTINNIDFQAKGLSLIFNDGNLKSLVDGWFLFNVGSTQVNVSSEEATNVATEYANSYSWNAEGIEVIDFKILDKPVSTSMIPHTRDEPLALIPYWYVILQLDRIYPGDVHQIAVGVWADTGRIADINLLTR